MTNFKGFDDWIPIFQGGRQTDSAGRVHDGDALIAKALANFDAAKHEPPVVIGHPAENAPAWGWVEGLKKQGDLLLAKIKQVEPGFADMVRQGLFKKRSAAFYPDGSLRHVGFLGAAPPAVKGLPDLAFAAPPATVFEFADNWKWRQVGNLFRRLREWLIEKYDQDTADRIAPDWEIEDIRETPPEVKEASLMYQDKEESMNFKEFIQKLKDLVAGVEPAGSGNTPPAFSEADLAAAKNEAARAERERLTAEFAERDRQARLAARRGEIASWCDAMVAQGKMTPAMVKYGVPEMLLAFAAQEEIIEFGETKEKATLYERFRGLWETEIPKVIAFGEVAKRQDAGVRELSRAEFDALTPEARTAHVRAGGKISE